MRKWTLVIICCLTNFLDEGNVIYLQVQNSNPTNPKVVKTFLWIFNIQKKEGLCSFSLFILTRLTAFRSSSWGISFGK